MNKQISILLLLSVLLLSCKGIQKDTRHLSYKAAQETCRQLEERDTSTNNCMCGSRLPKFQLTSIAGQSISSNELKGKLTILHFWHTECLLCVAGIDGFNALIEKYGKDKINFISIANNTTPEVKAFLEEHPWDFEHISNELKAVDSVFQHQLGYPATYLLDKDGVIIRSFTGGIEGEQAGLLLQQRLVASIEEALRTSPKESRKHYPEHVGNIEYDSERDESSFKLCNSENQIKQYFNNGGGLEYIGEKAAIVDTFNKEYQANPNVADNGLLTIRFVVNCQGKTDRFRLSGMNNNYQATTFDSSITKQILRITKSLKGWKTKTLHDTPIDYYQVLHFKIENGKITEILP